MTGSLQRWEPRDRVATVAAVISPPLLCVALLPFRERIPNTHVALLLVLVITAVAANGNRTAGVLAALGSGAWFDFFFTEPYLGFSISDRTDLETAALLLLVGLGVTESAVWGRRQHAAASRDAGYLAGLHAAAALGATDDSTGALIRSVSDQLVQTLGLRSCQFQYGLAGRGHPARLQRDGEIVWERKIWDSAARGLPVETEIELLVESHGQLRGRFLLTAKPGTRTSREQRLVAVTLADQVGAALT